MFLVEMLLNIGLIGGQKEIKEAVKNNKRINITDYYNRQLFIL